MIVCAPICRLGVCACACVWTFLPFRVYPPPQKSYPFNGKQIPLLLVTASPGLSGTSPTNFQSPSCFIFKEVNPWGDIPGDCKKISGARSWVCLRILVFDGRVNRFESSYRSNFATDRSHATNLRSMNLQFFVCKLFSSHQYIPPQIPNVIYLLLHRVRAPVNVLMSPLGALSPHSHTDR